MLGSFPALVRSDTVVDTAEEVKDALLPEKPKVKTGGVRLQRSSSSHLTLILRRVSMQWRITLQPTRLALQFGQLTPGEEGADTGGTYKDIGSGPPADTAEWLSRTEALQLYAC